MSMVSEIVCSYTLRFLISL